MPYQLQIADAIQIKGK